MRRTGLDTEGLVAGSLTYTKVGQPPTRSVYIARPTAPVAQGGVRVVSGGTYESQTAKEYTPSSG